MQAVRDELRDLRVRSVAVVTPYPEALTGPIRAGLEADGLAVPAAAGLGLTDSLEIAAVPPEAIVRFAVETFRRGPADAVLGTATASAATVSNESIRARITPSTVLRSSPDALRTDAPHGRQSRN